MSKSGVLNLVGKKHPALHEVSMPVLINDDTRGELIVLAARLLATVRVKKGLAIAAPQVGINKRVVVLYDGSVWVNPRITIDDPDETTTDVEACLSLPGRAYEVERANNVTLSVASLQGEEGVFDLDGLEARMIQHEIDHLDGVLISERGKEVARVAASMQL